MHEMLPRTPNITHKHTAKDTRAIFSITSHFRSISKLTTVRRISPVHFETLELFYSISYTTYNSYLMYAGSRWSCIPGHSVCVELCAVCGESDDPTMQSKAFCIVWCDSPCLLLWACGIVATATLICICICIYI